jgi:hypothetical protein
MPTFTAPSPITAAVDLAVGRLHVVASERDDVVVTVLPTDPAKASDARSAEETEVSFADDVLSVTGPRTLRHYVLGAKGTVTVTIELPAGSALTGKVSAGSLETEGPLGAIDVGVSAGDARIDAADRLDLRVSAGSAVVGRAGGPTSIKASAGNVRVRELAGEATIRCANGSTTVGAVTGSLTVSGAHGGVVVARVRGALVAKASSGSLRVEAVESGSVELTTSYGSVEVGIPEGTAALLDVSSDHGTIRNQLTLATGPLDEAATAQIHARTGYGDVLVRRPDTFIA